MTATGLTNSTTTRLTSRSLSIKTRLALPTNRTSSKCEAVVDQTPNHDVIGTMIEEETLGLLRGKDLVLMTEEVVPEREAVIGSWTSVT